MPVELDKLAVLKVRRVFHHPAQAVVGPAQGPGHLEVQLAPIPVVAELLQDLLIEADEGALFALVNPAVVVQVLDGGVGVDGSEVASQSVVDGIFQRALVALGHQVAPFPVCSERGVIEVHDPLVLGEVQGHPLRDGEVNALGDGGLLLVHVPLLAAVGLLASGQGQGQEPANH